jgi:hypothetical protein
VKLRIDGVLLPVASLPMVAAGNVVARLKVRARLLTYHPDRPQEGRIQQEQVGSGPGGPSKRVLPVLPRSAACSDSQHKGNRLYCRVQAELPSRTGDETKKP